MMIASLVERAASRRATLTLLCRIAVDDDGDFIELSHDMSLPLLECSQCVLLEFCHGRAHSLRGSLGISDGLAA